MGVQMKKFLVRSSVAAFATLVLALSGCGGGGGGGDVTSTPTTPTTPTTPPPATVSVSQALATAAAVPANDTSVNQSAPFTVLQGAGVAAVTVNSAPVVNFAVFSDGKLVQGLTTSNVRFGLAKLVPGAGGEPDQWVSYVYRTETATATVGPNGKAVLASAKQATTDPLLAAPATPQLTFNPDGYYTYTFSTDIKDPTKTNGVTFEPGRTHRLAIQLSYTNAAGKTVRVNPYLDFTIDASGKSVPVTASQTRKMVDIATCNNCHNNLALHGGGRVDTEYCVVCHNNGTTDANSGLVLNMATMVHKIHAGRMLHEQGENYVIWGNSNSKHDYSEVGFPQPIRNCVSCHDGSNPKTPQGDNWKSVPSKDACLSCHQSGTTSAFHVKHVTEFKLGASAAAIPNSTCANCHGASSPLSAEKAHWVQEMANAGNYEAKILGVTIKKAATSTAAGTMTVKVSVINPKTTAPYDLREGCNGMAVLVNGVWTTQATTTDFAGNNIVACNSNYRWDATLNPANVGKPTDKFGMFTVYVATETLAGVTLDDTTATASMAAYRGVNDGSNRYSVDVAIPAGSKGNARVMVTGAVSERRLDPVSRAPVGRVPPVSNDDLAYVPVKNAIMDVNVATGAASTTPRRAIVSNDNCNSCHAILGLPMGTQKEGFHKAHRNNADGCAMCHNANQAGTYTLMADGSTGPVVGDSATQIPNAATSSALHESYQAKRFVHGIHYGSKRTYPFTHCMTQAGEFNKDGTNKVAGGPGMSCTQYPGSTLNFTAEVAYPGNLKACDNCHVKDSWKQDRSVVGSVVFKPTGKTMLDWLVMSPTVATCTTCHDAKSVQTHVKNVGGAFGNFTQNDLLFGGKVFESCEGCHAPGSTIGIDTVHTR
jgi:OmcA/MtrC family decaheme c-type cytochrome